MTTKNEINNCEHSQCPWPFAWILMKMVWKFRMQMKSEHQTHISRFIMSIKNGHLHSSFVRSIECGLAHISKMYGTL